MFGGLKNLASMASLLQNAGGIKEKFAAVKERISRLQLEGAAGGDLVRVTISGDLRVLNVSIQQGLIESRDREMIENLTKAAVENAIRKAKEAAAREMAEVAGELNIPGLQDAITKFGIG
jgi:DNA-binding YbaB/EbfC family protein